MELKDIVKSFSAVLSPEDVSGDKKCLDAFTTDNPLLKNGVAPACVVRPADVDALTALVAKANETGANLTVSSSQGPHFRGGISGTEENVLIDLSSWDKVEWINRRNRVVQIQSGVTYPKLLETLKSHGMTVSMPLSPRSTKSVVASVMDREPTTWANRQWDISDPVASTEFIFPGGELFRTGAAGGPGTLEEQRASGGAQKCSLGPSQTDFHRVVSSAQGSMGVVTWITMRCELLPTIQKPFVLGSDDLDQMADFVYEVQRPWLGEHSFVLNRTALAMLLGEDRVKSDDVLDALPGFICLQNIAGFERLPEERVHYQENDIRTIATKHDLKFETTIGGITALELQGTATTPCGDTDWRFGAKGHCLSIIFLTTLDCVSKLNSVFMAEANKKGVEEKDVGIYIQPVVQNHAAHVEYMIPFDPEDKSAAEALIDLEAKAVRALADAKAFFSRPYGTAGDVVFTQNPMNYEVLKKVKAIFDPNRVMNRGKWGL